MEMTAFAPPDRKRPRGRPVGSARNQILGAARILLSQRRYDAVSVPEIVALAGVAQGTFYRYFAAKGDLIGALSHQVQTAIETRITSIFITEAPLTKILALLLDAGASVLGEYADVLPFLSSDGLLFGKSTEAEARRQPHVDHLIMLIERDQQSALLGADIVPANAARLISAVMDQVARDLSLGQVTRDADRYKADALTFLTRALSVR